MAFLVIDKGTGDNWGDASILVNEDGANIVIDTLKEAQKARDNCQNGIIIGDEEFDTDIDELSFVEAMNTIISNTEQVINNLKENETPTAGDIITTTIEDLRAVTIKLKRLKESVL